MTTLQILAVLLTITAMGSYVNARFIKAPATVGIMGFTLVLSLLALIGEAVGWLDLRLASSFVARLDFSELLLHGVLAFLLFAGALHINLTELKAVRGLVFTLATLGVALATVIIGSLVWLAAGWLGLPLTYLQALLFGALIAPTDPIAVLAILKTAQVPRSLYIKIGGESLFNDGVAVVVFLTILSLTTGAAEPVWTSVGWRLLQEIIGGGALGFALGWGTYWLLRPLDDYKVEVLLTLALVSGGYVLAEWLHVSAPICMVVAGLIIGNHGRHTGMSATTRQRLDEFWELLDDVLNAVLFMLLGLTMLVIPISGQHIELGVCAIFATLVGRFVSVSLPMRLLAPRQAIDWRDVSLMTWGGLRGGLSVAMALALPAGGAQSIILPVTYSVVLFSILVQGLSFKTVLRRIKQF
jgi:monovalent cation:H+ antiporter, CPA1 family